MKRILTHAVTLLLIVFLLPVCSAEARSYDFKVLLEGKYYSIYADETYVYAKESSVITSKFTKDMQPVLNEETQREEIKLVNHGSHWGGINRDGELVIPVDYAALSAFSGGYATAKKQDQTFVILDTAGNEVLAIDPKYSYVSGIQNGLFFVSETSSKLLSEKPFHKSGYIKSYYGFAPSTVEQFVETELPLSLNVMDLQGNLIAEGFEPDCKMTRYTAVHNAETTICTHFEFSAYAFTDMGIAYVKRNGKYGIIDTSGNVLYDFVLDSWEPYKNDPWNKGYVAATAGDTTTIFDPHGVPCAPLVYPYSIVSRIYDSKTETARYLNSDGETVCRFDCHKNAWYDGKGSLLPLDFTYAPGSNVSDTMDSFLLKTDDNRLVDVNLYKFGSHDETGLIAINEIPEPQAADGSRYICMMLNNPLINLDGEVSTIVENNYFFTLPLENDRTLVPMRVIFEALGAQVAWDGDTQTVTATKGGKTMRLELDKNEMYLDNATVWLDTPPRLIEDCTLVPLRAVSESFGADVLWDGDAQRITITWN